LKSIIEFLRGVATRRHRNSVVTGEDGRAGDKKAKIPRTGLAWRPNSSNMTIPRVDRTERDARAGIPLPRTKGMPGTMEGDEDTFVVLFSFFEASPSSLFEAQIAGPRCDAFPA
jgi:hypothetical protein